MSGGTRIAKADLIRLARALGVSRPDELAEHSMSRVFEVCMQTAEQLGSPAMAYPGHGNPNPIVRDWARRVLDDAVELVQGCRMEFNETPRFFSEWLEQSVRRSAGVDPSSCDHHFIDKRCLRCATDQGDEGQREPGALPPLALVEDRTVEQLRADGDLPCDEDEEQARREDERREAQRQETMVNHCLHTLYDGSAPACPDCGQSLQAVIAEDRQRAREGADECDHAGAELAIDRATGEERCNECGELTTFPGTLPMPVFDRRENAEQWAKTMGSKGGAKHA